MVLINGVLEESQVKRNNMKVVILHTPESAIEQAKRVASKRVVKIIPMKIILLSKNKKESSKKK